MKLPRKTSTAFNRHVRELRREGVSVSGNKVTCNYMGFQHKPPRGSMPVKTWTCKDHKTANSFRNAIIRGDLCAI